MRFSSNSSSSSNNLKLSKLSLLVEFHVRCARVEVRASELHASRFEFRGVAVNDCIAAHTKPFQAELRMGLGFASGKRMGMGMELWVGSGLAV